MIYASLLAPILLSYSLQTPRGPVVDHTGKPLTPTDANIKMADGGDPLLLRAARGETVERPPVWMMRQAGRHMKVYRDLCKKYPTFRQRSEIAEVATEISLQPWNAYQTDGVILFSDILTPLPGMGVDFDILEKAGPKMTPIRSQAAVDAMHLIDPDAACPFVRQALGALRLRLEHPADPPRAVRLEVGVGAHPALQLRPSDGDERQSRSRALRNSQTGRKQRAGNHESQEAAGPSSVRSLQSTHSAVSAACTFCELPSRELEPRSRSA